MGSIMRWAPISRQSPATDGINIYIHKIVAINTNKIEILLTIAHSCFSVFFFLRTLFLCQYSLQRKIVVKTSHTKPYKSGSIAIIFEDKKNQIIVNRWLSTTCQMIFLCHNCIPSVFTWNRIDTLDKTLRLS